MSLHLFDSIETLFIGDQMFSGDFWSTHLLSALIWYMYRVYSGSEQTFRTKGPKQKEKIRVESHKFLFIETVVEEFINCSLIEMISKSNIQ
jgi:hypothetical protein